MGHNVVDTIIVSKGLEITFDFELQPKNSPIPKTKRALSQLLQALSLLRSTRASLTRVRVLMDGGYTNQTVIPSLKEAKIKYIGTTRRDKIIRLFGKKIQVNRFFKTSPEKFKTIDTKRYYYDVRILNVKDLGRHQVFAIKRDREKKVKYYLTNDLKMTPLTFLRCLHERWWIEQSHRDLKQHCGLRQMFVRSKPSVQGITKLCNLMKNFLAIKVADSGLSLRTYPIESIIEKEFSQFEQDFIQMMQELGILEEIMMG